jgi:hypothetical protein
VRGSVLPSISQWGLCELCLCLALCARRPFFTVLGGTVVRFFTGYMLYLYYLYSMLDSFAGPVVSDRRSHCSLHSLVSWSCPSFSLAMAYYSPPVCMPSQISHKVSLIVSMFISFPTLLFPRLSFQTLAPRELRNGQSDPSAGSRPDNPLAPPADQNTVPARPICPFLSVREIYPCCLSMFMIH